MTTPTSASLTGGDNDKPSVMSVLDANNHTVQEEIALLVAGSGTGSNPASPISRGDDGRVSQLEEEIELLRAEVHDRTASIAEEAAVLNAAIERAVVLEEDRRLALECVVELGDVSLSVTDVQKAKAGAEARSSDVEAKMKDTESRLAELETKFEEADKKLVEAEEKAKEAEPKRAEAGSTLETPHC
ncbi:CAP-gly domain protein, putative, partial [Rhizoctonia solani AG-3 Rhs1AP]